MFRHRTLEEVCDMTGNGPTASVQLVIHLFPDGRVNVTGPIANKPICYWLLEEAKDLIKAYRPVDTPRVVLPSTPLSG